MPPGRPRKDAYTETKTTSSDGYLDVSFVANSRR